MLRALASGPLGVTEVAKRVELPKSTVARLLTALENEGVVAQDRSGGRYRLGDGLADLAGAARPGRNLVAAARPVIAGLAAQVGETAGLSIRDGSDVYYLDHEHVRSEVQVRDWTGEYAPLHTVPSGMVLLATASQPMVDEYLAGELTRPTGQTVTDPQQLKELLVEIRKHGYAWGYEEYVDGINSVAAPVMNRRGEALASLHVHGPAYRFPDPEQTHDIGLRVMEAAAQLAALLRN